MNPLSVITDEISQDLEEVIRLIEPYHLTHIELRKVWQQNIALFSDENLDRLKRLLDENRLKVSVISGPVLKCVLPTSWLNRDRKKHAKNKKSFTFNVDWNISLMDRVIEIAEFLDVPYVRAFSFFKGPKPPKLEKAWPIVVKHIQDYVDKAKVKGKTVVVENEGPCFVDTIPRCLQLLEDVDDSHLKLICDPGNFFTTQPKDIYAPRDYEPIIPHTAHMHVKDPLRKIPFFALFGVVGEGNLDYPGIFQKYLENGYRGFFSLETHAARHRLEISLQSLQSMQDMLQKISPSEI